MAETQSLLLLPCYSCQHAVKDVVVSLLQCLMVWSKDELLLIQSHKQQGFKSNIVNIVVMFGIASMLHMRGWFLCRPEKQYVYLNS